MTDGRGSTAQLAIAGFGVAMFAIALGALVSSQLSLMSVLDPAQAEQAADQIATSRFTAEVIEQTVERAVTPIAGADIATQLATATSTDPQVTDVISSSLMACSPNDRRPRTPRRRRTGTLRCARRSPNRCSTRRQQPDSIPRPLASTPTTSTPCSSTPSPSRRACHRWCRRASPSLGLRAGGRDHPHHRRDRDVRVRFRRGVRPPSPGPRAAATRRRRCRGRAAPGWRDWS